MDPLMGVVLGAGIHLEALRDKAINPSVRYWSLAVIYSTWLSGDWSFTCSCSVWLMYKYNIISRGNFWQWFFKGETQTVVEFSLDGEAPHLTMLRTWGCNMKEQRWWGFWRFFEGITRRNVVYSLELLMTFLIYPSPLQEVCPNGCSVAGCRHADDWSR